MTRAERRDKCLAEIADYKRRERAGELADISTSTIKAIVKGFIREAAACGATDAQLREAIR